MRRRNPLITAALCFVLAAGGATALSGCAAQVKQLGSLVQGHTEAQPQDANDLGTAELSANITFTAMDAYVQNFHPSKDTLHVIDAYRAKIYTELVSLRAAHARGESLTFTAFNDAVHVWLNWKAQHGSGK